MISLTFDGLESEFACGRPVGPHGLDVPGAGSMPWATSASYSTVRLREMSFRLLSEEELAEKRRAAEGECSERYRGIYASLGLSVVAHSLSPSRRRARRKS